MSVDFSDKYCDCGEFLRLAALGHCLTPERHDAEANRKARLARLTTERIQLCKRLLQNQDQRLALLADSVKG